MEPSRSRRCVHVKYKHHINNSSDATVCQVVETLESHYLHVT